VLISKRKITVTVHGGPLGREHLHMIWMAVGLIILALVGCSDRCVRNSDCDPQFTCRRGYCIEKETDSGAENQTGGTGGGTGTGTKTKTDASEKDASSLDAAEDAQDGSAEAGMDSETNN
jgi:hypothetical protein